MKTALLLSGHARFCAEFDMQIDNLNNSQIDWFVVLWTRRYGDGSERNELMPPSWQATNVDEARSIIESKLPPGHRLAHIELVDPKEFPTLTKQYKRIDCNVENLFQQYWMLKKCDLARQKSDNNYDLVIRSRPDIGIDAPLDLVRIHNFLEQNPNYLITPSNRRNCGFNDMFAVGLPNTIKTYCEAVDHIDHFNINLNVQLHSELMISTILGSQGLQWPMTNFKVSLRQQGTGSDVAEDNDPFIPYFGKWV